MTFFGLKQGQDLENKAAHPHQKFPGVPPGNEKFNHLHLCLFIRANQALQFDGVDDHVLLPPIHTLGLTDRYLAVKDKRTIALMHVYVTQANFTTKPRFEIKNKRSLTEMNSQGSRVEKNTHAQKVQMQKILFTNEACW